MKLGSFAPKNPLSGGAISLSPASLIAYVLGGALILVIFGFAKTLSTAISSKLPGRLSNYGTAAPIANPYGNLIVHQ